MRKALTLIALFAGVIVISSACKKSCTVSEEHTHSGEIALGSNEKPVIIYPKSGGLLGNLPVNDYHIHPGHTYEDRFEVSFDGGVTRVPFTSISSSYSILGMPTQAKCEVSFDREVTRDDVNSLVTYTVDMVVCDNGCDDIRTFENYVLVPAIPQTYSIWNYSN